MLGQIKRDAEKDGVDSNTVDVSGNKYEQSEIEDFSVVVSVSRAAILQRALKWAGLKSVS